MLTLSGHVVGGVIVLEPPASLPEGAKVRVSVVETPAAAGNENRQTLAEKLLQHAGKAQGLPADLARCHDHYIHGTPRE